MDTALFDRAVVTRIQRRAGANADGDFGRETLAAIDATLAYIERTAPNLLAARFQPSGNPTPSPDLGARIVLEAARFVGLTETVGNRKWDLLATPGKDPIADELVRVLTEAGWQPGWPYCAAFVEAVWRKVYSGSPLLAEIAAVLNPHCLTTWRNAKARGWTTNEPTPGAVGIMQKGGTDQGHAFIVESFSKALVTVRTIEANTSPGVGTVEEQRNGDGIYRKSHVVTFKVTAGLHILGFIRPPVLVTAA